MLLERMQSGHLTGGLVRCELRLDNACAIITIRVMQMGCNASQTQASSVLPSHVSSEEYGKHPSKHVKLGNRKKLQLSDIEEKNQNNYESFQRHANIVGL